MTSDTDKRLRFASGYIDLMMLAEAARELAQVAPLDELLPEVVAVELRLSIAGNHWDAAAELARHMTEVVPKKLEGWILLAFALRRLGRFAEARDALLEAEAQHRDIALLHYHAACCFCQLGEVGLARCRLARALELNPELRENATDDPELLAVVSDW